MASTLTASQLEQFRRTGILVIEGLFTSAEVTEACEGLHRSLAAYGVVFFPLN